MRPFMASLVRVPAQCKQRDTQKLSLKNVQVLLARFESCTLDSGQLSPPFFPNYTRTWYILFGHARIVYNIKTSDGN